MGIEPESVRLVSILLQRFSGRDGSCLQLEGSLCLACQLWLEDQSFRLPKAADRGILRGEFIRDLRGHFLGTICKLFSATHLAS